MNCVLSSCHDLYGPVYLRRLHFLWNTFRNPVSSHSLGLIPQFFNVEFIYLVYDAFFGWFDSMVSIFRKTWYSRWLFFKHTFIETKKQQLCTAQKSQFTKKKKTPKKILRGQHDFRGFRHQGHNYAVFGLFYSSGWVQIGANEADIEWGNGADSSWLTVSFFHWPRKIILRKQNNVVLALLLFTSLICGNIHVCSHWL